MNPLIEQCAEISFAGYNPDGTEGFANGKDIHYGSRKLYNLGNFLLNKKVVYKNPKSVRNSLVICFGGGIDSYCALFRALENPKWHDITLLHVDYGQPYYHEEHKVFGTILDAWNGSVKEHPFQKDVEAERFTRRFETLSFVAETKRLVPQGIENMDWENYIIPARNLVLSAMATEYGNVIWIVANRRSDESVGARDKTSKFYRMSTEVFSDFYQRPILVESPVLHLSKLEMVREHLAKGYSVESLKQTFSCYSARPEEISETHCGVCLACWKRWKLFQDLNISHNFRIHPKDGPNFDKYQDHERRKRG